ncbi:hypothetical protein N656DRAFT_775858 [Canariomyces notabilis]|uniref:Uncharacterized protein n=1 Tax=Canariomyces notabilis TaxID=2074819 RepID=A0AAN6TK42_9PEZI|nr:hypothetical protein N656DRAFT_775858 [Canariomyces arenarius]
MVQQAGLCILRPEIAARPDYSMSQLPEEFFQRLLKGGPQAGILGELKLPEPYHEFAEAFWEDHLTIRKITEDDATRFFAKANKPTLTVRRYQRRIIPGYPRGGCCSSSTGNNPPRAPLSSSPWRNAPLYAVALGFG